MREWHNRMQHLRAPDVNGIQIRESRCANDLVPMALSLADAQGSLATLGDISDTFGLSIHPGKTKLMVIKRLQDTNIFSYRGVNIPRVIWFKYLGARIEANLDDRPEIRMRIGIAKADLHS